MAGSFTFPKKEKLTSLIQIQKLFKEGKTIRVFPFTIWYRIGCESQTVGNKILISVSKHYFKHAVDRNRLKRLTREAYRLNKNILGATETNNTKSIYIGFIYQTNKILDYKTIESSIKEGLQQLTTKLTSSSQQ